MNDKKEFDFISYISDLTTKNKLAVSHNFYPCQCTGIHALEGMLTKFRTKNAFVCSTDATEGTIHLIGGSWFKQRIFTVFIVKKYRFGDMEDYNTQMDICRELFRQFHSRFIVDENNINNELLFLEVSKIRSKELGSSFLNGCTGLYFMISFEEATNLVFNEDEWTE